jgi:hypothetical protein
MPDEYANETREERAIQVASMRGALTRDWVEQLLTLEAEVTAAEEHRP